MGLFAAMLILICVFWSLVPVLAIGFDDLQQRVDAQTKQAAEHQEKLKVRAPCPPRPAY